MSTDRTGRSVGAFVTGLLMQLVSLSVGVVTTPLLLKWLGDDRYGAFRVASDWASYLGLLELGVSGSLMALLAQAVGQEDPKQIHLTLVAGIRAYLHVTIAMVLLGLGLGCFITQLVQVKETLVNELEAGYWLGLLGILLVPFSAFRQLANASQRSHIVNILTLLQSLLITSTGLLLAWAKFGMLGQYMAVLTGNAFFYFLICRDGLSRYPTVLMAVIKEPVHREIERKLWQLNLPTMTLVLATQVGFLTDNIVISYTLGPALVVPFFITQRLAVLTQIQIQAIGNATWAALSDLHSKGEHEQFNARLVELTQLVMVVAIALMGAIAAYNPYFVKFWVGEARYSGSLVSGLAASNGILLGLSTLWTWCFIGTGQINKVIRPIVVGTLINLVISLIGTRVFGVMGPLLGTFLASVMVNLWWLPRQLRQVFGTSVRQLFRAVLKPLILGLPYVGAVGWVAKTHAPEGWLSLAIAMAVSVSLYLVLAWCLVLTPKERSQWRDRVTLMRSKFAKR